ncbi:SusC/RagA family TonB-linked outer membrane protein [Pedobacter sp. N23S346]|uniref:SusC/RagA family TonB-linked outer membrane protein n=1 Tax=Pedobacter sp. N23S346 TaxID=3402750 RepID=UPI003ABE67F7
MTIFTYLPRHWQKLTKRAAGILLFVFTSLIINQKVQAQTGTYSFTFNKTSLETVIAEVTKKTGYEFIFDASYLREAKPVTIEIKAATAKQVFDAIFKGQNFNYEISNKTIILKPVVKQAESAAKYTISGQVIDSLGTTIPGVNVRIKGTNNGVQTDGDGRFNIELQPKDKVLLFDYIGYKEREYTLGSNAANSKISIVLSSNANLLEEVFINGFQQISKERNTATYTVIDNKKLNEQVNVDLLTALEGRVPGLNYVKNKNGADDDKPRLRGISTMTALNESAPLIVIDGLPTEFTLAEINPYDIESITVLRDAAASSIYGARSSNGVIVLTTKQGKGNNVKISLNADLFITEKPDLSSMHYASTSDLIDFETAVYNAERSRYANTESMFAAYGDINNGLLKYYSPLYQLYRNQANGSLSADQVNSTLNQWRNNDYINQYSDNVWQNEIRQRYNLSLSSAAGKTNTYFSLNYDEGQERIVNNKNQSINLNFKTTYNFKKWLVASFGINGTYVKNDAADNSYNNINLQERYARILDENGNRVTTDHISLVDGFVGAGQINAAALAKVKSNSEFKSFGFNILDALDEGIVQTKVFKLRSFANLQATIFDGLTLSSQFQYENTSSKEESYYSAESYKMRYAYNMFTSYNATTSRYVHNLPNGGRYKQFDESRNRYTFRNQLSFNRGFGAKKEEHYISAIAGLEIRQTQADRPLESIRYGYDPQILSSINLDNNSLNTTGISSYFGGTRTLGLVSRVQDQIKHRFASPYANASYTYLGKYNLTGSIRVDKADLFGVDAEFKNRPLWSAGAGWNASSEDFIKNISWINLLKVRATYGINGNIDQTTSKYLNASRRADGLFPSLTYTNILSLPNPKLRWEKSATTNFGIDYALLNSRLTGSIDLYNKESTDLLVTTDLDPTVGTNTIALNNGALQNRGIEISLTGNWLKTDDWNFSTTLIYAYNKNTIKAVNNATTSLASYIQSPTNYFLANTAYNTMYAYRYGGMINGYPYVLDQNGQSNVTFDASGTATVVRGITSTDALVNVGQIDPKYNGSVSQRISYKNFEFGALFIYSGGNVLRKDVTDFISTTATDEDISRRWNSAGTSDLPRLLIDYPQNLLNRANVAMSLSDYYRYSDLQILDASYIKLRNISLSYNLPSEISSRLKLGSVKFTAQINNLWYWSAAGDDIDPEAFSLNSGTRSYSIPKSFIFGLNVNF